jgi:hypothetical protein
MLQTLTCIDAFPKKKQQKTAKKVERSFGKQKGDSKKIK